MKPASMYMIQRKELFSGMSWVEVSMLLAPLLLMIRVSGSYSSEDGASLLLRVVIMCATSGVVAVGCDTCAQLLERRWLGTEYDARRTVYYTVAYFFLDGPMQVLGVTLKETYLLNRPGSEWILLYAVLPLLQGIMVLTAVGIMQGEVHSHKLYYDLTPYLFPRLLAACYTWSGSSPYMVLGNALLFLAAEVPAASVAARTVVLSNHSYRLAQGTVGRKEAEIFEKGGLQFLYIVMWLTCTLYLVIFHSHTVSLPPPPDPPAPFKRCDIELYPDNATALHLASCGLADINDGTTRLRRFHDLEYLDLSGNLYKGMPTLRIGSLRVLRMGDNPLESVTGAVLPQLEYLDLTRCGLQHLDAADLPPSLLSLDVSHNLLETMHNVTRLEGLQKLLLTRNFLKELPPLPATLQALSLAVNPYLRVDVAKVVHTLPALRWLSCSAPLAEDTRLPVVAPLLQRTRLDTSGQEVLGRTTSRVKLDGKAVVLKTFAKTLADQEASVSRRIDTPYVVKVLGVVEGPGAAVVEYLQGAQPLGRAPDQHRAGVHDLQSFDELPVDVVEAAVGRVAAAMAHLHDRGVAHGALSPHSVLWTRDGGKPVVKLCRLGAAWFFPASAKAAVAAVELKAYAALVEDLRMWCTTCTEQVSSYLYDVAAAAHDATGFADVTSFIQNREGASGEREGLRSLSE